MYCKSSLPDPVCIHRKFSLPHPSSEKNSKNWSGSFLSRLVRSHEIAPVDRTARNVELQKCSVPSSHDPRGFEETGLCEEKKDPDG